MRSLAALGAAVVLALAGCSGEEARPSTLPPLASGSPSASAVETPRTKGKTATAETTNLPKCAGELEPTGGVPQAAKAATPQGASIFARHYMDVLQRAIATADAVDLKHLSNRGCGGCQNLIAAVEAADNRGQRVRGGEFIVQFAEAPLPTADGVTVDVRYMRRPGVLLESGGEVVEEFAAEGPVDVQLRLGRAGASWEVLGFRVVPS